MDTPDFIVPPPGLIPEAPQPRERAEDDVAGDSRRVLPAFPPPSVPLPAAPTGGTTLAPGRAAPTSWMWRLRGPAGFQLLLLRPVLLGRDPSTDPAHAEAASVALVDPARTVSKTHARIEVVDDQVLVTDLHSTNGTRVLDAQGEAHRLVPGRPAVVAAGASVLLGEFAVRVDRAPSDTV